MSLSFFREAISKKLQERVDVASTRAINMRVHAESSADGYALVQADTLAEARAFAEAINIITTEYKRMTETTPTEKEPAKNTQPKEKIYG